MSFTKHCLGKAVINIRAYCVPLATGFRIIQPSHVFVVLDTAGDVDTQHSFLPVQTFYG